MPRVSIVIPSYNRANLIPYTIESALEQTYKDYEIIVVDDGSTDDTLAVLSRYGNKIRVITQPHFGGGGAKARNTGIHAANGEYIALLDSDDLWLPIRLEKSIELLDRTPGLLWVYNDSEVFDHDSGLTLYRISKKLKLHEGDVLKWLVLYDFIPTPTHVVNRKVFDVVGEFWHSPKGTDWDMNLRIAAYTQIRLIPESLTRIRKHKNSVTGSISIQEALQARTIIVNRAVERDKERLESLRNKALSRLYVSSGQEHAVNGDIKEAKKLFVSAIITNPVYLKAYVSLFGSITGQKGFLAARNIKRFFMHKPKSL